MRCFQPWRKGRTFARSFSTTLPQTVDVCVSLSCQHACQSEGNALYFHGGEAVGHSFASTKDVDLHREEGRSYWEEDFESSPPK